MVELYPGADGQPTAGARNGLRVASLDDALRAVDRAAVTIFERDGARIAVVRDPDGHTVELAEHVGRGPL